MTSNLCKDVRAMRAIIRWGLSLLCLLLLGSFGHGYVWVSPVTKCPLGHAPDLRNTYPTYVLGCDGRVYGPYWYVMPPFAPHQGYLPGAIGQAIQSGFLPYELLQSKEGMEKALQGMPLLSKKHGKN